MRKRDKVHKQAINSSDDQLWAQYRKLRNQSTLILRKQRKQYFKSTLETKGRDPKAFWKILHTVLPGKTKSQANINKLTVNDTEITESNQLANTLNDYFITVAPNLLQPDHQTKQEHIQHPNNDIDISRTPELQKTSSHFSFRKLTVNEVFTALKTTNPSKATGADDIPAKILKAAASPLSELLTPLMNLSSESGVFPDMSKIARILPKFKGGTQTDRENYRPISILPAVSKIHERFVNEQLQEFARENGLITPDQFAYSKNSSTTIALLRVVDEWKWAMENKQITSAVFLDLRKAFDVIDHSLLLQKLRDNGITGIEHTWFQSYLTDRRQFVQCNGVNSNERTITHGVPQGSVLGPTLFCIHINGLISTTPNSSMFLYADDTEVHHSSSTLEDAIANTNHNLQNISTWLQKNNLIPNTKKTEAMVLATKKPTSSVEIYLNNDKLNVTDTFRYLGVTVDSRLTWEPHITELIKRVSPKLALLGRLAGFLELKILLRIYKQTILPVIDYGCIIWHESNKSLSDKLEKLQNQAMRVILKANRTTCTQHMRNSLGLLTLYNRRRFLRFIYIFKIVNKQNCPKQLEGYFTSRNELHGRALRNSGIIDLPQAKTLSGRRTFKHAGASDWNSLPTELRKQTKLSSFKLQLFKHLKETDIKNHKCSV